MSGGRLNVIGDYYTDLITVSCSSLGTWNGTSKVIEQLNSNPSPIETAEGYELSDFDNWTRTAAGTSKVNTSDTKIDMLIIIWRNNRYIDGNLVCAAGYAIQEILGFGTTAIQTMTGADLVGSFNACTEGHAQQIVVSEYFHTLFGGNNWHCGSGAAPYTFLSTTSSFSMAAQASCVSQIACAWDRQHLGYYGWKDDNLTVPKTYLISALNTSRDEVQTNITIQNYPNGGDFILRDFIKTGDAIQIKLPHLNWSTYGDKKNQYLWVENHQKLSSFDHTRAPTCSDWVPGMLAYIQVGKDIKGSNTSSDLYPSYGTSDLPKPNAVGSWLFPISAEGNFDFYYLYDNLWHDTDNTECIWNGYSLPKDQALSVANPFTGFSELFSRVSSDEDNTMESETGIEDYEHDIYQPGSSEKIGGVIVANQFSYGDAADVFTLSGNHKMSIGTNPSTTPVYTYISNSYQPGYPDAANSNFENRTIYLNGLSVEIISETSNATVGGKEIIVRVKWDDYSVNDFVRWSGNIVLQNDINDPLARQSQIILQAGKTITLARGKSPTQHVAEEMIGDEWSFTEPTILTLKNGTKTTLKNGSSLIIQDGSKLVVESGAELIIEQNAFLDIQNGSTLVLESGGIIKCTQTNAKILVSNGGTFLLNGNNIQLNNANARIELVSGGKIQTAENIDFSFTGSGYLNYFSGGSFVLGLNSRFDLNSSGPTYRVMQLNANALLQINGHEVEVTNAKIIYKNGSTFKITGSKGNFDYVTFTDNNLNGGHAIYAYNTDDLTISHSTLDGFSSAVLLEDIDVCPSDVNVKIDYCTFTNHDFAAVEAYNVERMRFYTSTAIGRTSVTAGLFLEEVDECTVQNSNIYDYTLTSVDAAGVFCHKVSALIIDGSSIHNNEDGIETRATNIYVRNGGVIKDNTTGIYAMSSHDGYTNPDMPVPYMIVVGDIECGWIINNDYGIVATDMTLYIDQIDHANASPNPFDLNPNRFDGNTIKTFDICFEYFNDVNEIIMARHNYWTGGVAPTSADFEIGYDVTCNGFTFDASDFRTTQPTTCDCYGLICATELTFENIQLRLSSTSCNEMITKQGGGQISIANQYRDGYLLFRSGAYNYAYQKFNWLNNRVASEKGTAGLPDGICKQIHQSSIMLKELSDILATVHCQYPFWIDDREAVIEGNYSTKFLIFPNPAQTIITLGSLDGLEADYQILSLNGVEVSHGKLTGSVTIDISNFSKGVYLVMFRDENSNIMETQKIILQ